MTPQYLVLLAIGDNPMIPNLSKRVLNIEKTNYKKPIVSTEDYSLTIKLANTTLYAINGEYKAQLYSSLIYVEREIDRVEYVKANIKCTRITLLIEELTI